MSWPVVQANSKKMSDDIEILDIESVYVEIVNLEKQKIQSIVHHIVRRMIDEVIRRPGEKFHSLVLKPADLPLLKMMIVRPTPITLWKTVNDGVMKHFPGLDKEVNFYMHDNWLMVGLGGLAEWLTARGIPAGKSEERRSRNI